MILKGIDQIKSIGYRISSFENDFTNYKLICSPMVRTRHTMQIIQEILNIPNMQIFEEDLLMEKDAGNFTNISKALTKEKYPEIWEERKNDFWNSRWPNGENNNEFYERALKFYEKYKKRRKLNSYWAWRTNKIYCTYFGKYRKKQAYKQ